ncbi:RagB/SusD family nutrient uptake outer membrane protein [Desertivirga xinjiangensis]|uniref:RagB/SusD family nutrient uptake outer membrane protein n=1 Tax=Desertivirga xinjiangensis TaxID=539206 RepID=UPI00210C5776|nr:RagB/SusD family nutrient uptake outer membrane protein [Pedobacter xinjiangensis]
MKITNKLSVTLLTLALLSQACKKILEEEPKTSFTTEYFKTPQGIQQAINTIYSGMRYNYGPTGGIAVTVQGTDEFTFGDQPRIDGTGDNLQHNQLGTYNINPDNGAIQTPWNRNYQHINLCNAVIEFASETGLPESQQNVLVGEARYMRAHYYMLLVTQFGAIPLDMGAGDLKFNTVPYSGFKRPAAGPEREALVGKNFQAMIDDLKFASENLPDQRPSTPVNGVQSFTSFKLSKAAALLLLSKMYIFRGYSAHAQPDDWRNAYNAANELISNQSKYGVALQQNFADIYKPGNDYNSEILYSVERVALNNESNEVPSPGTTFDGKANFSNNAFTSNYENNPPATYFNANIRGFDLIDGRPLVFNRPLRRLAPTRFLLRQIFADKVNDSRYNGSFRDVYYAASQNAAGTENYNNYVTNLGTKGFALGDTVIYMTPTNEIATALKALTGANMKKYWIISPDEFYTNQNTGLTIYPSLSKNEAPNRAAFNDASGRPYIVSKLGEAYLLAAEAAMQMGDQGNARKHIVTLRERAAYRSERAGMNATQNAEANAAAKIGNVLSIPATIDLDFILDERSRELAGESMRWADLAMRGKLLERIKKTYTTTVNGQTVTSAANPDAAPGIKEFHVLRPIPKGQLDAVDDPDKAKFQNPGY